MTIFHCARGTHWYNNYTRWFQLAEEVEAERPPGQAAAAGGGGSRAVPAFELPYGFLYEPWFIGHRWVGRCQCGGAREMLF